MVVLAFDDNKVALTSLVKAIKSSKIKFMELLSLQSLSDVLQTILVKKVDVAFLNINAKKCSGLYIAKKIKQYNKCVNIIFVSAYSNFRNEAIKMHASCYVLKPFSNADIKFEFQNLLYPITSDIKTKIYFKTFGYFEVFYNGNNVKFKKIKSKELLAYLVDRQGACVTRNDIIAILFDKDTTSNQAYFGHIWLDVIDTLKKIGCEDILIKGRNQYGIDISKVDSDLARYLRGDSNVIESFNNEYMEQYEWSTYSGISFKLKKIQYDIG